MAPPASLGIVDGCTPVIVRVGGLPVDTLDHFASSLCSWIEARLALEARSESARAELVGRLHAAVPNARPELRRFLLVVKRDCHNARPIHERAGDVRWGELQERAGPVAGLVVELDREAAALDARFEAAFAAERERQGHRLLQAASGAAFRRGLALASPDLFDALRSIGGTRPAEYGRKERKTELSLLRYVTRAAIKVSPFSTFTPVALGTLSRDPELKGIRLQEGLWLADSLVRIKRYLLHRVSALLSLYLPFRERLRVELNDSLSETSPARFLYLRPQHWELGAERDILRYRSDALAAARLRGPLIARLSERLSGERPTYRDLVLMLASEFPAAGDAIQEELDRLLHLGVLQFLMPWPAHEGHLEVRMLEHLRTLPPEPALDVLTGRLSRLAVLERGYPAAADPAASVRAIDRAIDEVGEAAAALAGLPPSVGRCPRAGRFSIYEDVFLRPSNGGGSTPLVGIVEMSHDAAAAALENAELLVRLSVLADHRQDFLHTLGDLAGERWPGRGEVGVLEVLQEIQPLWHDYLKTHLGHWRDKSAEPVTWNPRVLPRLEELHRWRKDVSGRLEECIVSAGEDRHLRPDALRALLDQAPAEFTDARAWGAMLMLQQADLAGSLWIVNRLKEGTGRYGSRYTPVMDRPTCERYTAHLAARSAFELGGEPVELLDVHSVAGDTLNVHHPQTRTVLTMPDDEAELSAARRVRLRDLCVAFGVAGGLPRLCDRSGNRYLAVNLGVAFEAYMPTLVKFLCLFGPSELGTVLPPRAARPCGPLAVSGRMVLGNLVVHRRRWEIPAEALRAGFDGRDDAQAFAATNRFRMRWGIPERVFFSDVLSHDFFKKTYKPQYLDFTSPLFVPMLRDVLGKGEESLRLTEVLPTAEMCPRDDTGQRWAVEVLVDSLALRRTTATRKRTRSGCTEPAIVGGRSTPR